MDKHTPGPWFSLYYKRDNQLCEYPFAISSDAGDVALATENEYDGIHLVMKDADRCLLEAAPALLAACEALVEWATDLEADDKRTTAVLNRAVAAIALARGEAKP